jgi:hypothetical protein
MKDYYPDRWVILEMRDELNQPVKKVFSGWYGGYLGSDIWRLSSGITSEQSDAQEFVFENISGSVYHCQRHAYGMSGLMCEIYESWIERLKDEAVGSIEIVDRYGLNQGSMINQ